jgi:hypothetical protein
MHKPDAMISCWSRDVNKLDEFLTNPVRVWLDTKTREFLLDYLNIKYCSNKGYVINDIYDYSYLMMPAFKALEGTMLQIGRELSFDLKKYDYSVGGIFSEDNLNKYYDEVLDKIGSIDKDKKMDIRQWLDNARRILRSLRHNPAHYNGDVKNYVSAFNDGEAILFTIKEIVRAFIDSGLVTPSGNREEDKRRALAEKKRREMIRGAGLIG